MKSKIWRSVPVLGLNILAGCLLFANPVSARGAFENIASYSFDSTSGGFCKVNGDDLGCANNGKYVGYDDVDFGSATSTMMQMNLGVTRRNANMLVEIRTGSATGPLLGSFNTVSTDGAYKMVSVNLKPVTGKQKIFLTFPGSRPTGGIDLFKFVKSNVTPTPVPVPPPTPVPTPTPTPVPSPMQPPVGARFISPQFFGMHLEQQFEFGFPSVSFGIQRTWNAYPAVFWESVAPNSANYNWTNLDNLVADSLSHNVEILYTMGHVPRWASSNPNGPCTDSATGTCYAPDMNAYAQYVTLLVNRYKGKIKYYELWNEPDANWAGSQAQLVAMAKVAYPIIKAAGGIVLTPSPQGKAGPQWMEAYFAAGGAPYSDINAFHAYLYDAPEALGALVKSYQAVYARYGVSKNPMWDTEHSWGIPTDPFGGDIESQSAWLARFQILSAANNIERSIWYGWEFNDWGTLFDKATRKILKTGLVYQQVHNWLVNTSIGTCTQSGTLYQCPLYKTGYQGLTVWATSGTTKFTVPAGYTRYRTVEGTTVTVSAGSVLTLGAKPFLLEKN